MDALRQLQAIEDIKRLKARYCRFVDLNRREELRHLFTDDIVYEFQGWKKGRGADSFAGSAEDFANRHSFHRVSMPDIKILSETTARGIWAMVDIIEYPEASGYTSSRGYGYYHEEYRKVDGVWRISSLLLVRHRVEELGSRHTGG
ncbi:MAG: nuclear transport factor 2 family protein [bacterium]|nr:nuclear transport factor 2 family protein [bacterium]